MNKVERWWMVKRLRRLVRKYDRDSAHFNCGQELAEHIRPDLYCLRVKAESIIKLLRADSKEKATGS